MHRFVGRLIFVGIAVIMTMVQVGQVIMNVFLRLMFVPVHMVPRGSKSAMGVIVMAFIVLMTMLMRHRIVAVEMGVLLAEKDHKRDHNYHSSNCLNTSECFSKNGHG